MEKVSREQKYQGMRETLNEKQWRQYLALEAKERGTIAEVASEAKVSRNTVKRGMREREAGDIYQPGERIRKEGGGRKPLVQTDATLLSDLEGLLDPKGDSMSLVQWTSKSLSHLTYDMVIEKDAQFFRLQCKAGRYDNGVIKFNTCSVNWWNRTKRKYTREEIDYFAVYCEHTGKVYLVPVEDVGTDVGYLRVEPTANNQAKGVRWAQDYEI